MKNFQIIVLITVLFQLTENLHASRRGTQVVAETAYKLGTRGMASTISSNPLTPPDAYKRYQYDTSQSPSASSFNQNGYNFQRSLLTEKGVATNESSNFNQNNKSQGIKVTDKSGNTITIDPMSLPKLNTQQQFALPFQEVAPEVQTSNNSQFNLNNNPSQQPLQKTKMPLNLRRLTPSDAIFLRAELEAKNPEFYNSLSTKTTQEPMRQELKQTPKDSSKENEHTNINHTKKGTEITLEQEDQIQQISQEIVPQEQTLQEQLINNTEKKQTDHKTIKNSPTTTNDAQLAKEEDFVHDVQFVEPQDQPTLVHTYEVEVQPEHFTSLQHEFVSPQPKAPQHDFQQMYIDNSLNSASRMIDNWADSFESSQSNMYSLGIIENQILDAVFIKGQDGKQHLANPEGDLIVIEKLLEKYEKNEAIQSVLQAIKTTVNEHIISGNPAPKRANNLIAFYYQDLATDVLEFMHIKPRFDKGQITNIPTIETIIKEAQSNPTPQALKALQAAYKATNRAILNAQQNNNSQLIEQLTLFKNNISIALENPRLTQPQSWGQYAASFLPSTQDVFNTTGLGDVKVSTVINAGKSAVNTLAPYTGAILNSTGIGKMTLSEVAEQTGVIPSEKSAVETNPFKEILEPLTRSQYEQNKHEQQSNEIIQQKAQANIAIDQYYTSEMQRDVVAIIPQEKNGFVDPIMKIITNMPSVELIIQRATEHPSQQAFNALQSTLKATQMAIHVAKESGNASSLPQLKAYENQITTILQSPNFTPFQSWSSYAASFMPSTKTILKTTGLGDVTVNQTLSGMNTVAPYAQYALGLTGVENMTVSQALTHAGIIKE